MLFTVLPISCFADDAVPEMPSFDLPVGLDTVKVGLCSGSSAVYTAYLNTDGDGYQLGFFDFSRNFHMIGSISKSAVVLGGDVGFSVGDEEIGAYHILHNSTYSSFDEAASAASAAGGFPAYIDYKFCVLTGSYDSSSSAKKAGGTVCSGSGDSVLVVDANSGKVLFLYDCAGRLLALRPNGEAQTNFDGNTYKGDFRFSRKGSKLCVTNYVGLEDYVKGVLPYEVSADWPVEALKAQAVCARTYAFNNINGYADRDFDVRDDTYSQVYKGCSYNDSAINAAAEDTAGKFVRYDGTVCRVYYMSSDGGGTEDGINVFGERRAYLKAVGDTFEMASDFYGKTWTEEFTPQQLTYELNDWGYEIGEIADLEVTYSDMGNAIRIDFTDVDGKVLTIERLECYSVLGLNSIRYDVRTEETDEGDTIYVFDGCGWGHNCGMSQWGACSMAKNINVTCDNIISFYFSGAYIA